MTVKIKHILIFALMSAYLSIDCVWSQESSDVRHQYLVDLKDIIIDQTFRGNTRRVAVQDSTWTDWLTRTRELPPDFSKMKSTPFLPDGYLELTIS